MRLWNGRLWEEDAEVAADQVPLLRASECVPYRLKDGRGIGAHRAELDFVLTKALDDLVCLPLLAIRPLVQRIDMCRNKKGEYHERAEGEPFPLKAVARIPIPRVFENPRAIGGGEDSGSPERQQLAYHAELPKHARSLGRPLQVYKRGLKGSTSAFWELWDEVRILGIVGRQSARRPHSFSHELMSWRVRAGAWGAEAIVRRPVVSQNSIPIWWRASRLITDGMLGRYNVQIPRIILNRSGSESASEAVP